MRLKGALRLGSPNPWFGYMVLHCKLETFTGFSRSASGEGKSLVCLEVEKVGREVIEHELLGSVEDGAGLFHVAPPFFV